MFPLGTVLFPGAALPLQVFEPRYCEMTEVCLRSDGRFGVVLIEHGSEVGGGDTRFGVGTVARIVEAARTPDGRYLLTAVGVERFRVKRWLDDAPYPRADVDLLSETKRVGSRADASRDSVERLLVRALALRAELGERIPPLVRGLDADPVRASFQAAAAAALGPFDSQQLLELDDPVARFESLGELLDGAIEVLQFRLAAG